jgi:hypothetical protein
LIIGADEAEINLWRKCCQNLNLPVIAEVISQNHEGEDIVNQENDIFTVTIHKLSRGANIPKGVEQLGKFLADSMN